MITIPVVADISIMDRPVAAKTDKDVLAMVVRINMSDSVIWSIVVINGVMISRPDNAVTKSVAMVTITMDGIAMSSVPNKFLALFITNIGMNLSSSAMSCFDIPVFQVGQIISYSFSIGPDNFFLVKPVACG
jgi:hypothetical protein